MDAIAVRAHHCEGIACSSNDFSRTSWLWSKSGSIVCQAHPAHPSYKRSQIIYQPSRAHNVFDLQQHDELFREGVNGNSTVYSPSKKSSVLEAKEDCYDGVIVNPNGLPADVDEFIDCLRTSLSYWKTQGKRGIWLQLPIHKAEFVPAAIKEGFVYHHAEPTYVMMTYWIPEFPSTLPPNASHQVGIGAFVMNEFREVLAVQEKNGPLRGSGVWKMPTGLINQAEDLCAGAVREVKEETGVDTEFIEVVGFRHGHYVSFNKSDLYFLCALRPLSLEIVSQDGEIEAAKWMPLEEFRAQPFYNEGIARMKMLDLCIASFDGNYEGFKAKWMESGSLLFPSHYFFSK